MDENLDPNEVDPAESQTPGLECNFKWNKALNRRFIELRRDHEDLFTGQRYTAAAAWSIVLEKLGLEKLVSTQQAKKKWENLKKKYKDCKYPKTGEGVDGSKSTAATWVYFDLMDEVLGQRHSINPPVLVASVPEEDNPQADTPGSGTASGSVSEGPSQEGASKSQRKRGRDEELLELLKEDMQLQREAQERRAQESRERMDRLFSLLERMVDK